MLYTISIAGITSYTNSIKKTENKTTQRNKKMDKTLALKIIAVERAKLASIEAELKRAELAISATGIPIMKAFDWDNAARLIRDANAESAFAGLSGKVSYSDGLIFSSHRPVDPGDIPLSSVWATPVIIIDEGIEIPCWVNVDHNSTYGYWTQSALDILEGKN